MYDKHKPVIPARPECVDTFEAFGLSNRRRMRQSLLTITLW